MRHYVGYIYLPTFQRNTVVPQGMLKAVAAFTFSLVTRQCTDKRNIVVRSHKHCCGGKEEIITYSECVFVALVICIQSVCALLYCYLWSVRPYPIFSILSVKRHGFLKIVV